MHLDITTIIVIITVLVSLGGFSNQKIIDDLIFFPPSITYRNQWYRFITCGFIHADAAHLIFNMFSLYLFGRYVEDSFTDIFQDYGKWLYLLLYITSLIICLLPTYFRNRGNYHYRSLGASGAVSAVVFAGLILSPGIEVGFFVIPPIIPGFIFGPLYLLVSIWLDKKGGTNINHSAHIWGAVYGLAFIIIAGSLVGFNAYEHFLNGVNDYIKAKGWSR